MNSDSIAVIIGGSHAASQLIASLRQEGWIGRILVISDEKQLPYHRPPLSKTYLSGEKTPENLLIRKPAVYEKLNVKWLLETHVEFIDRATKSVVLGNGERLKYDKLALCTGARVKKLAIAGSDLSGIHYLRNLSDAEAIKKDIKHGGRAVIIGGGYIGLETAALLRKLGMAVDVLVHSSRVLRRVTAGPVSDFFTRLHSQEGIQIHTREKPDSFEGDKQVESVICASGKRFLADLVIIGIGVTPNTELAEACGLPVDDGIIVDEFCASEEDRDIVAVGDCAKHPSSIYNRFLRLESVPNASEQAMSAAATMCGKIKPYAVVPWFWSDQYDVKLQMAGLNDDYDQMVIRGDIDNSRSFVAWYFLNGKLVAADCVNRPQEFRLAQQMLKNGINPSPEELADDNLGVKQLLELIE